MSDKPDYVEASTEPDMVERVAKAIYDAEEPMSGDHVATVLISSDHLFPGRQHLYGNSSSKAYQLAAMDVCRTIARAAIEAMMEPTEAMRVAGEAFVNFGRYGSDEVYQAMLRASLKEGERE